MCMRVSGWVCVRVCLCINYANIMIGDINVHKFNEIDLRASRYGSDLY